MKYKVKKVVLSTSFKYLPNKLHQKCISFSCKSSTAVIVTGTIGIPAPKNVANNLIRVYIFHVWVHVSVSLIFVCTCVMIMSTLQKIIVTNVFQPPFEVETKTILNTTTMYILNDFSLYGSLLQKERETQSNSRINKNIPALKIMIIHFNWYDSNQNITNKYKEYTVYRK